MYIATDRAQQGEPALKRFPALCRQVPVYEGEGAGGQHKAGRGKSCQCLISDETIEYVWTSTQADLTTWKRVIWILQTHIDAIPLGKYWSKNWN